MLSKTFLLLLIISLAMSACSTDTSNEVQSGDKAHATKEEATNIRIWLKQPIDTKSAHALATFCGTKEKCGRIAYGGGSIIGIDLDSDCWVEAEIGSDLPDSCLIFKK